MNNSCLNISKENYFTLHTVFIQLQNLKIGWPELADLLVEADQLSTEDFLIIT